MGKEEKRRGSSEPPFSLVRTGEGVRPSSTVAALTPCTARQLRWALDELLL
jgi:hypothetical protein